MMIAPHISAWLLQAAGLADTTVVKTTPAGHSLFEYTSGTLQIIVLLLGIVMLAVFIYVLLAVKKAVDFLKHAAEKLQADAKPILNKATAVADDAREVVATVRNELERVTHAAEAVSDKLLNAAATTERRMDDINAVIDVVQGELEETVMSTAAALRGVRMGGRAFAGVISSGSKRKERDVVGRDYSDDGDGSPRLRERSSQRQRGTDD